jgi:HSP20 family protein
MLSRRAADCLTARVFDSATLHHGCRLDAYREGDTYYIDIDLPGIDPATIDMTVDDSVLTVRAERTPAEREGLRLVVADRPDATFTRQVFLSDAMSEAMSGAISDAISGPVSGAMAGVRDDVLDTDRLDATYDNGVLTLRIPLAERNRPRRIEITPATAPALAPAA